MSLIFAEKPSFPSRKTTISFLFDEYLLVFLGFPKTTAESRKFSQANSSFLNCNEFNLPSSSKSIVINSLDISFLLARNLFVFEAWSCSWKFKFLRYKFWSEKAEESIIASSMNSDFSFCWYIEFLNFYFYLI